MAFAFEEAELRDAPLVAVCALTDARSLLGASRLEEDYEFMLATEAKAALRVIEAETAATRHRLRAIRERWIPRLESALTEITLAIEEQEQADAARLRRAGSRPAPGC